MPMSLNRIRLACDLSEHPLERLFPIIKYHYKWPELKDIAANNNLLLRKQGYAKLRGVQSRLYREEYSIDTLYTDDGSTAPLNHDAEESLREFLEVCKDSDIENILFVELPHVMNDRDTYERQQRANAAAKMITDAGFEYMDFNSKGEEIGLDYIADFSDPDHMNAPGQKKFTRYFGKILCEKYGIEPMAQNEKNRARWEESAGLMDSYYELFDEYTQAHSDEPYKKAEFLEADNIRTMQELERIMQGKAKSTQGTRAE